MQETNTTLEAEFYYRNPLKKGEEKPSFGTEKQDSDQPTHQGYLKAVGDARVSDHNLSESGFKLINHKSSIADFYDQSEITNRYYLEMHDLVKKETGADTVTIHSHINRNEAEAASGKRKGAHRLVHNDFTTKFKEKFTPFFKDSDMPKRISVFNLWRRFDQDGLDAPFAVCDSRTVSEAELIPTDLYNYIQDESNENSDEPLVEICQSSHSVKHRWYYYPRMNRDEVLMFKTYYSTEDPFLPTLHSAFDDVAVNGKDVTPRESIEVRAICFFN